MLKGTCKGGSNEPLLCSVLCPCDRGPSPYRRIDHGSVDAHATTASGPRVRSPPVDQRDAIDRNCGNLFPGHHLCNRSLAYREPPFVGVCVASPCRYGNRTLRTLGNTHWPAHARNPTVRRGRSDQPI